MRNESHGTPGRENRIGRSLLNLILFSLFNLAAMNPTPSAVAEIPKQILGAQLLSDRLSVTINGQLFTQYRFRADQKYPYFYPLNGPRTGSSLTTESSEPYPHHHSLFFGCDRVNGGNYWQEGLERGQIVSQAIRLVTAEPDEIVFENDCRWQCPDADPPFADRRRVAIRAPSPDLRWIQFEITLEAQQDIRIEPTNHSLFSARVVSELSVASGGTLVNAHGDRGEKATFGKTAPWCDYWGTRQGESEGLAILVHPSNPWYPPPWFTRDYGFFSPTPMNGLDKDGFRMKKGDSLHLKYGVVIHAGNTDKAGIARIFQNWIASK